jgi:hypothetical protein
VAKDFKVRLKCPYGDQDQWVMLTNREETLKQILDTPWDFECPLHGVQREIPMEASEQVAPREPRAQGKELTEPASRKVGHRSSARVPLHLPVLASKRGTAFHEDTSTLLVNATGGLLSLSTKTDVGDTVSLVNKQTQEEQECRVAYVGPEVDGKIRVGVAFQQPAPSFWRAAGQERRVAKPLRVQVRGMDRIGNPFVQSASAIDISQNGARLEGVGYLTLPGETIEVKCRWRKARFRVVWVGQIGTTEANQIGVRSLEPEKDIW